MATVTAFDVARFVGRSLNDSKFLDQADEHLRAITALVRAHTRGRGFTNGEPTEELRAVIVSATARLLANPDQLPYDVGAESVRGGFTGFNLAEQMVLNGYRRRSA